MSERQALILAPFFPPSNLAGVHRPRLLAKYLKSNGWHPTVLTVDEAYHDDILDFTLLGLVPDYVRIVKVGAFPLQLTKCLGFGDLSLRGYFFLRKKLLELLSSEKFDIVFITGSPFYPMLLSREIKRKFKLPVVLDFQDPWVSNWGVKQRKVSKPGFAHILATKLEPRVVDAASFITAVSEVQNQEMRDRYTWLDASRMAAIPIGGDPDDFKYLRECSRFPRNEMFDASKINFCFVGTYMPRSVAPMSELLNGIKLLHSKDPIFMENLQFNFVGTSNTTNERSACHVLPMARKLGIAHLIREIPNRIPYLDAIGILAWSQAVMLIGSDERHYTASKIYPGLMSGRPFLSIFHRASSSHSILANAGGGIALSFENAAELSQLAPKISNAIRRLVLNPRSVGSVNEASFAAYTGDAVAKKFVRIFENIVS